MLLMQDSSRGEESGDDEAGSSVCGNADTWKTKKPPSGWLFAEILYCTNLKFFGVADGARTHDNRNHNPGLYQLSYSHH